MRLLLTGATGVAGLNIYRTALGDPTVTSVTLLQRREMPSWAVLPDNAVSKSSTVVHSDFTSYSPELAARLSQHDACIWAMGKSSRGMNETEYTKLTYEMPMALIEALQKAGVGDEREEGKPFRFVYVSGNSADPTEKSSQMWARVKGRTEKDLTTFCAAHPGMRAHILRPGYFFPPKEYPADKANQRSALEGFADRILGPVFSTLIPNLLSPPAEMAKVALEAAKGRWSQIDLFSSKQMREMAKEL